MLRKRQNIDCEVTVNYMKKISLIALMATLFLGFASTAEAINFTIGDSRYLGSIDPSTPANETAEAGFINQLIDLAAPSGPTVIDGKTYIRTAISCGACVDANAATALSDDVAPFNPINLGTGWTYLYGKYGTTAHVWLVTGVTGTGHTEHIGSKLAHLSP